MVMGLVLDLFEELVFILKSFSARLVNLLNWRLIRSLGELQILTRASYIMLILVPILAATWPAVRLVVNQHNKAVREAQAVLERTKLSVEEVLTRARSDLGSGETIPGMSLPVDTVLGQLQEAKNVLLKTASEYTDDYARRSLKNPTFPWTFAAAFFASLFVVFGHTIYQLLAPDTVRKMTWDEFISYRKEEYAKHKSEDALTRAREHMITRSGRRLAEDLKREDERILARLYDSYGEKDKSRFESELSSLEKNQLISLEKWIISGKSPAPPLYQESVLERVRKLISDQVVDDTVDKMTTIERGARAEYLFLASSNFPGVILTGILYGLGVAVLFSIIRVQVNAVILAAEWDSVIRLFTPG